MKFGSLWVCPVKSLGGVAVPSVELEPRGFSGDRRWMIIDAAGRFVTRRELPALARIDLIPYRDDTASSRHSGESRNPETKAQFVDLWTPDQVRGDDYIKVQPHWARCSSF